MSLLLVSLGLFEVANCESSNPLKFPILYSKPFMMPTKPALVIISDHVVVNKIYEIRGQKVMLDSDLAELYGVPTKV